MVAPTTTPISPCSISPRLARPACTRQQRVCAHLLQLATLFFKQAEEERVHGEKNLLSVEAYLVHEG